MSTVWHSRSSSSSSSSSSSDGEAPERGHDAAQAPAGSVAATSGSIEGLCRGLDALGRRTLMRSEPEFDVVRLLEVVRARAEAGDGLVQRALHHAAATGHAMIVRAIVMAGVGLNAANSKGATALMQAAQHGHLDCLQLLLAGGADKEAADCDGMRALHHAAAAGDATIVRELVTAGADLNAAGSTGTTAIMLAAQHLECLQELLAGGADKEAAKWGRHARAAPRRSHWTHSVRAGACHGWS